MNHRIIDSHAIRIPKESGLPLCLHIPIAARDTNAIEMYVGKIIVQLSKPSLNKALLVKIYEPEKADVRLPIWSLSESTILNCQLQVWVHVDYNTYRRAYIHAFPGINLDGIVLDHIMNRREARLKGFQYLRIVPISRKANSSHGSLSERWGVDYHSSLEMIEVNRKTQAHIQYADLADIVKMMNMEGGGSLMDNVNEAQKLVAVPNKI
jgi:hypothetical protein